MFKKWCVIGLLVLQNVFVFAQEPLPVDEAFAFSYEFNTPNKVLLSWQIADGHYLYKQKFKFVSLTPDVQVDNPIFPVTEAKQDKNFGNVEVYRQHLELELPVSATQKSLDLEVTFQGCADSGVCYLPIKRTVTWSQK